MNTRTSVSTRRRRGLAVLAAISLVAASCGGDSDDSSSASEPSASQDVSASSDASEADARDDADASASEADAREDGETSEAAPETTLASETTAAAEEPAAPSFDADQQKVADAWAIVFDSSTGFDDKAAHIEDADQLQSSIETFGTTGTTMGGIALKPTGVDITDDAATVTFDVIFAGTPVHSGLTGQMSLVDGTWQVSHTEFCGIMTQAQIPCE